MTRDEIAIQALASVVRPHVIELRRNRLAFEDFVAERGVGATIEEAEPVEIGTEVSPTRRHWRHDAAVVAASVGAGQDAARHQLIAALSGIAADIIANPTLAGSIDSARVSGPIDTEETRAMGGDDLAARAIIVSLFYSTGENPMETVI